MYRSGMKHLLASLLVMAVPALAGAEEAMTPIQQYLYSESGYAPVAEPSPQQVIEPQDPYETAAMPPEEQPEMENIHTSLSGMNY